MHVSDDFAGDAHRVVEHGATGERTFAVPRRGSMTGRVPLTLTPWMPTRMQASSILKIRSRSASEWWGGNLMKTGLRGVTVRSQAFDQRLEDALLIHPLRLGCVGADQANFDGRHIGFDGLSRPEQFLVGKARDARNDRARAVWRQRSQSAHSVRQAAIGHAHRINDRTRLGVAHQSREGITRARLWSDRADHHVAEAEVAQARQQLGVLVEAGARPIGFASCRPATSVSQAPVDQRARRAQHLPQPGTRNAAVRQVMRRVRAEPNSAGRNTDSYRLNDPDIACAPWATVYTVAHDGLHAAPGRRSEHPFQVERGPAASAACAVG